MDILLYISIKWQIALFSRNSCIFPKLREQICDVMALEVIKAHPDDVIITTGSQQALDLISRIFIDPGDVVLVEAPSYVGALGTFKQYEALVVHVGMDEDGLIPQALRDAIKTLLSSNTSPLKAPVIIIVRNLFYIKKDILLK